MGTRLGKAEVTDIISDIMDANLVIPMKSNFYHVNHNDNSKIVYVSQCKPSSHSKGNWDYLFFHTITEIVLERVLFENGNLVLINYVHRSVIILNAADIAWAIRHSSRVKNTRGKEEHVTDFVVEELENKNIFLTPYNRNLTLLREVKLIIP
tara:strand:+ start:46 stop:501 length:456 start_codon:yes stop_codon:yes gene_type:complete